MTDMFIARFNLDSNDKNLVEMGKDLAKHNFFENYNSHNEFARFSNYIKEDQSGKPVSYSDKNKRFHDALMTSCCKVIGRTYSANTDVRNAMMFDSFRTQMFNIIGIVVGDLMSKEEVGQFLTFADVVNVGWGDSLTLHVGSRGNYRVAKIAKGKNRPTLQKMYQEDITLTPEAHGASVQFDFAEIMRGDVNWGEQITRIMRSFLADISQKASDTMFGAYDTLSSPFVENAYSQTAFTELAERVAAANGVTECIVYGTKSALGKIIPSNQYFGFQKGSEYMDLGYVNSPFGVPIVQLAQAVKPESSFDFVLPNDKLIFLPNMGDKPVKIAMEGNVVFVPGNENDNAARVRTYSVQMNYDVQIATGTIYGMMAVA